MSTIMALLRPLFATSNRVARPPIRLNPRSSGAILSFFLLAARLSAGDAFVDTAGIRQLIRGFGGSSAWHGQMTDNEFNSLYSNGNSQQIGLSILRIRIDPNQDWATELSNAGKAKARGASILATPWTPPASMKDNNNVVQGHLKPSEFANYASYLKKFCDYMSSNGAALSAISVQNEPDITVTYESCLWSATQLRDFLKNNGAGIGSTKVLMPESFQFNFALSDPTLNDSTAASRVSIVGGHLYGANPTSYSLAKTKKKEVWMTEYFVNDQSLTAAISTARQIHDCMTISDMSAYIWWFLRNDASGLINTGDALQKRAYVLGQFAKFIRPGYTRVNATYNPSSGIYVSGYKGSKVVIVAINQGTSAVNQRFIIQNTSVSSVTPWVTSSNKNIAQGSKITVSAGSFTASLPAQSVTTFVQN